MVMKINVVLQTCKYIFVETAEMSHYKVQLDVEHLNHVQLVRTCLLDFV